MMINKNNVIWGEKYQSEVMGNRQSLKLHSWDPLNAFLYFFN